LLLKKVWYNQFFHLISEVSYKTFRLQQIA